MTSRLFEKYTLNNKVEVPGRLVIAPLTLFSSNPDGSINDGERNYLKNRATGVGMYILGATAVSQDGLCFPGHPQASSLFRRASQDSKISRCFSHKSDPSSRSFCPKEIFGNRPSGSFS